MAQNVSTERTSFERLQGSKRLVAVHKATAQTSYICLMQEPGRSCWEDRCFNDFALVLISFRKHERDFNSVERGQPATYSNRSP